MTSSTERHREIIQLYNESNSVVSVVRKMKKIYPEAERLNRKQVHRIVRSSVLDQRYKNTGLPRIPRGEIKSIIYKTVTIFLFIDIVEGYVLKL